MRKSILLASIVALAIMSGCGKEREHFADIDELPLETSIEDTENTEDIDEKTVEAEITEPVEEDAIEEAEEIVIPSKEEVIRFWADNYEDIITGKYTGDVNRCIYVSAVDFDGDTMPELIASFSDGRGNTEYIRYLDVDPELKEIKYCKQVDETGKELDVEVALEPMMMFANEDGEKHYICENFGSEGLLIHTIDYDDICFKLEEGEFICNPTVTRIKEMATHYLEDDMGDLFEEDTDYLDGKGNIITEDEYYNEYGIYSYVQAFNMNKAYKVNREVVYTTADELEVEDGIYNELLKSYDAYALLEKRAENPYDVLNRTWTLVKTSIEGDEQEWDPELYGDIFVEFEGNQMIYDGQVKADFTLEYSAYYDEQELWYIDVEPFLDFDWVSFRLDDNDNINMMAIIRYGGDDYASIYWTFEKVEE